MAQKGTLFGKPRGEVVKRPGAFTAKANAAGKSTADYARSVLKPTSKASTRTKRQAALAQTFSKLRKGKVAFGFALVLGAGVAHAATVNCPNAWLVGPAPQAAAAVGPGVIVPRGNTSLVVQAISPSGTATVVLEMCCSPIDCSAAGTWAPVTGGSMSLAVATPTQVISVTSPACMYRANVTACSGCAVNVAAACGGP
jgi:hypothetical protein